MPHEAPIPSSMWPRACLACSVHIRDCGLLCRTGCKPVSIRPKAEAGIASAANRNQQRPKLAFSHEPLYAQHSEGGVQSKGSIRVKSHVCADHVIPGAFLQIGTRKRPRIPVRAKRIQVVKSGAEPGVPACGPEMGHQSDKENEIGIARAPFKASKTR